MHHRTTSWKWSRWLFAAATFFIALNLAAITAVAADQATRRPNILFIFSDDHADQAIGAYGKWLAEHAPTPNIDRIAERGMLFRNCLVTNSICGPSRAVIQTGKYSHLNGFVRNGNRFDGSQQTMPKLLQQAGYQTAVVGKWHLESDPTGYDYWHILPGQGLYYNPPMIEMGQRVKHEGYTTEIITDIALDWLKNKRDQDRPFLLMCQHKAPHRNWEPGPKQLSLYDEVTLPEPATLFDDYAGRGTAAHTQDMMIARTMTERDLKLVGPNNLTPLQLERWNAAYDAQNQSFREANLQGDALVRWKYQRYIKDYLRCIAAVDEGVGQLLTYLEESGLAENTIVIYSSDQGFYLGEHGWFDTRWIYEESLHTPLVVRWPGVVKPGTENTDLVSNLDFAETFLDIAGVPIPDDMQGKSLVPILKGETPSDWRDSFYYHYYEFPGAHSVQRHYGLRTDRYTLAYFYEIDEWELYDNQKDPDQLKSVYDDPAYAPVVTELTAELKRLREMYQEHEVDPDKRAAATRR